MPMKKKRPQVVKYALVVIHHPAQVLNWALAMGVLWSVMAVTWGLGGILSYPVALQWTSWSVPLVAILAGVHWRFSPAPRTLLLPGLMLVPWLAYLFVSWYFISPVPWAGALELVLWAQAATLMLAAAQLSRSRSMLHVLLVGVCAIAFLASLMALYQYFIRPGWLPLGRAQLDQYADRASGTMGVPNSLGGMLLLVLPLPLAVALMQRYAGPLRMAAGMVAIMLLVAIGLTVSRGAILVTLLVLVVSPFILYPQWRQRLRAWGWGLLALLALGGTVWIANPTLEKRLELAWNQKGEHTRPIMWETAWNMFQDNPMVGQGVSSYAVEWEHFRPPLGYMAPVYAHNGFLQVLGETGSVGFILLFAPMGWLLFAIWRRWAALPFRRHSAEASFRSLHHDVHSMAAEEKQRHIRRHKRARDNSPAPGSKVLLGGLLLGVTGLLLHLVFEFHLQIAAIVFIIVILLALMARLADIPRREIHARWAGTAGLVVFWLWGGALFAFSLPAVTTQVLTMEGQEMTQMAITRQDDKALVEVLRDLQEAGNDLRLATELDPGNADAWAQRGRALLAVGYRLPYQNHQNAREAEDLIRKAISLRPDNWRYWRDLGLALTMRKAPAADVEAAYQTAIDLAPFSPVSWYFMADYLSYLPDRREDARAAADRAIELYRDYQPAKEVKRRLMLRE